MKSLPKPKEYKSYAITITINKKTDYDTDYRKIEEIVDKMQSDYQKNFLFVWDRGYEITQNGRLHMHGRVCSTKEPYMKRYTKGKGINALVEPLIDKEDEQKWVDYCRKQETDPYWDYQKINTYMFQEE